MVRPDQPGDGHIVLADRVDAKQVSVGESAPWPARVEPVVVLPGNDQVTDIGAGTFPQGRDLADLELAPIKQVA
jgi:hypothetical protein